MVLFKRRSTKLWQCLGLKMLRLLIELCLLCCLVLAMDELEWDAQVAPATVGQYRQKIPMATTSVFSLLLLIAAPRPTQQLWRSWVGQLRQVFQRWHPALPSSTTTPHPRQQLRSTTVQAEELKPYGALHPMFQLDF